MVAAMRLSALLGNEDLTAPLIDILKHIGLPTELNYDRESIFNAAAVGQKEIRRNGQLYPRARSRVGQKLPRLIQKSCTNTF